MIVISKALALQPAADLSAFNVNSPLVGWHTILTPAMVSADSFDPSYPPLNVANSTTFLKWVSLTTALQHFTISTGDPEPEMVDYLAIARHNLGSAQIAVTVEALLAGIWTAIVQEVMLPDDEITIFRFPQQSLSDVRLTLKPGNAPPQIAVIYLGRILQLQRRIYVGHTPMPYGRTTNVINNKSESGNFLGRIILGQTNDAAFTMSNIDRTWYRVYMDPFIDAAQENPFFFSWRPGTFPRESGFAWMTGNPRPTNQLPNGMMQIALQMGGIVK